MVSSHHLAKILSAAHKLSVAGPIIAYVIIVVENTHGLKFHMTFSFLVKVCDLLFYEQCFAPHGA